MCLSIEIKDAGNYIRIEPLRIINYNSDLDWDKNWISTKITLAAGCFTGVYTADLTTFDFENIKHDLIHLYDNLNGSLDYSDLEGHLKLTIKGDGIGHFQTKVICCDNSNVDSAELHFNLTFDQTYIKPLVQKLNEITKRFPIIGSYDTKNNYDI